MRDTFFQNEPLEKENWSLWTLPFFENRRFYKNLLATEGYTAAFRFALESRAWACCAERQETLAEAALKVITLSYVKHN